MKSKLSSLIIVTLLLSWIQPALATKILVVGTTGDYQPLTWYNSTTNTFSGESIDLIRSFAKDSGYELKFVKTSWPALTSDLLDNKFQIAVGGISATPERSKNFLLSKPLQVFGKIPLVRCGDQDKYATLKKIDKQGVNVIENRGGTNEKFALSNLHNATLIIVPNNHLPFRYLIEKKADVMFTDSIEAVYQQNQKKGLCAVNPSYLYTHSHKVFLFKKNETQLRDQFNSWLATHKPNKQ